MGNSSQAGRFSVRRTEDIPLVKSLCAEIFTQDELDERLNTVFWLVWDKSSPVGFCTARPFFKHPRRCYLTLAGLLKRARGFRLHKRMIGARLKWARAEGMREVVSYTVPRNTPSAKGLLSMGFQLYDPQWEWVGEDVIYFKREI